MSNRIYTLLVDGKKIPVSFCYSCLEELEEHFDKSATELMGHVTTSFKSQKEFTFIAMQHGIRISKKKLEIKKEDLGDILNPSHFQQLCDIFIQHFPQSSDDTESSEADGKKK